MQGEAVDGLVRRIAASVDARRACTVVALAGAMGLALVTPALAASTIYYVQSTGDSAIAACVPIDGVAGSARCDSLRSAVSAANANPGAQEESDIIFLQAAGTYALTQAPELAITDHATIVGRGPRTTTIQGNGSARVMSVAPNVTVGVLRVAVAGGRALQGSGGNILNAGDLVLNNVRVTGGAAISGGGVANQGTLITSNVLIDGNDATSSGGGILNAGGQAAANVSLTNTTVAFNRVTGSGTGAGIASSGNAANFVFLTHVTLARNAIVGTGSGAGIATGTTGEDVSFAGSIVSDNTVSGSVASNCSGPGTITEFSPSSNVDDGTTCGFVSANQDPVLATTLSNEGGDTDVLTINVEGAARNRVSPCGFAGTDQRSAPRPVGACDAGAFQFGAVAPPIDSGGVPEPLPPTQPPPVPTPPPTPTPQPVATPTPVPGRSVVADEVSGKVLVKLPNSNRYVDLADATSLPLGTEIDARKGKIELTALAKAGDPVGKASFYDGIFKLGQRSGYTELTLSEKLTGCRKAKSAAIAAAKPKKRKLWGDGKGKFRTRGTYSAATVRGTRWLVQDNCTSTLTRVEQGVVAVRDEVKKKTIVLRAKKSYTARARGS